MPLMIRARHLCSSRAILYRQRPSLFTHPLPRKPSNPSPSLPLLQAFSSLHISSLHACRMPAQNPSSPTSREEPSRKKRRIESPQPRFIRPYGAMATSTDANPTTFELTESETKLRELLLGVAAYIDENASTPEENVTGVKIPDTLKNEKTVLRWTGGWVRDKLLGVESHDIDVAINKMTGEHFGLKMLEYLKVPGNVEKHGLNEKEGKRIVSGLHTIKANPEASKNLETATIRIMGIDLDLVNLRKEEYNDVSRNPEIEFGTAEEDAVRRDATVNAMFYNLNTQRIEDLTGQGFDDMAAKIIRTPLKPYTTFKDDPLRVLRLIRFASRLNYTIEPETAEAMGNQDIHQALKVKIKRERIGIELEKMLNGPDPHMALALINKFGLYETIFTDPTRELQSKPDLDYFAPAYDFINSIRTVKDESHSIISQNLLRNPDEWYLAWVSAALMPWADAPQVPHSKPSRPPYHAAYLVATEGFKAPNKIGDVIAASLNHTDEIRKLVEQCPKERDVLGMAIRGWGSTWRSQVLFSLIYEIVIGSVSQERILSQYTAFLFQLIKEDLLEADTFKPLINGKELASAMSIKPGPWMKDALDVVMAWQLRNPDVTDPAQAIEEVKKSRKGELSAKLITHFLELTIPPFFPQTKFSSEDQIGESLSGENIRKPWKNPKNEYFLDLLRWSLQSASEQDIKNNMHRILPPITTLLSDTDLAWRAKACELISILLTSSSPAYLVQHGYDQLFSSELFPFFNFLPSLTPEKESVELLEKTFPALITLCNQTVKDDEKEKFLDKIIREGVIGPLIHFHTPTTYPILATLLLTHLSTLIQLLQINSIKHLPSLLPLLGSVIQDPLSPAYPPLLVAAAQATRACLANGWPRFDASRCMEVYAWVCRAWVNCREMGEEVESVRGELREVFGMVDALMGRQNGEVLEVWGKEKERVRGVVFYEGLF